MQEFWLQQQTAEPRPSRDENKNKSTLLENDVRQGSWKVLHLMNQGHWMKQNLQACPKLALLVQQLRPSTMQGCLFGNLLVSVLTAGTTIEPHCGPTNVRHRLHLTLQSPCGELPLRKEATRTSHIDPPTLKVQNATRGWSDDPQSHDRCWVFDDSLVHSVTYPSQKQRSDLICEESSELPGGSGNATVNPRSRRHADLRVVFIIDPWHPQLTSLERKLLQQVFPA